MNTSKITQRTLLILIGSMCDQVNPAQVDSVHIESLRTNIDKVVKFRSSILSIEGMIKAEK